MSNTRHNNQQKDCSLERWRNLTLSTPPACSQPHQSPSVQRQNQSQPEQRHQQLQLQSEQRQHQSQPIQRLQVHSQPRQEQNQQQDRSKKRKSRGNRQLQRYRAKLRKQGLNNETITTLINNYQVTADQGQNEEPSVVANMDVELLVVPASNQVGSVHKINNTGK